MNIEERTRNKKTHYCNDDRNQSGNNIFFMLYLFSQILLAMYMIYRNYQNSYIIDTNILKEIQHYKFRSIKDKILRLKG